MNQDVTSQVKDGDYCKVIGGTHKGKSGTVRDLNISKTGHLTITVVQDNGERFKTLAKNVIRIIFSGSEIC
ncbi:KOW motif-containing protein [Undibacterium baiyunense]|uniref:KOW motif-containing protein n=1 Tax=Undibacterium baiyunense TaxID=2828731 RepID=A0A941DF47_9BURK|nr:KOW motif-containing protein [Undibacterium baiyunense]MBR7746821.1 KOW motif-containing protein [Undibacterium baiyunense]